MKIFDRVYVKLGNILFPAVIWGENKLTVGGEKLVDVLVVIGDVCLPRTYCESKIYDAEADKLFSFDTKKQLLRIPQATQRPREKLS